MFKFQKIHRKIPKKLYFHDEKGLKFLWSIFAGLSYFRLKVGNFYLHFFHQFFIFLNSLYFNIPLGCRFLTISIFFYFPLTIWKVIVVRKISAMKKKLYFSMYFLSHSVQKLHWELYSVFLWMKVNDLQ